MGLKNKINEGVILLSYFSWRVKLLFFILWTVVDLVQILLIGVALLYDPMRSKPITEICT